MSEKSFLAREFLQSSLQFQCYPLEQYESRRAIERSYTVSSDHISDTIAVGLQVGSIIPIPFDTINYYSLLHTKETNG